ncbi:MAG: hypothetical protein ACXAE3_00465 [Candidatus Kariarchaeaceae archaeon]
MSPASLVEDPYEILKSESIILIGERYTSRVAWVQLHMTSDFEEDVVRELMVELSQYIAKGRVPSGSARKFLDGKLIYYQLEQQTRCYAIFTNQIDNIRNEVKRAVQAVATRGGVYSAQRFFNEVVDILDNPEKLDLLDTLSSTYALTELTEENLGSLDLNDLGFLISHANQAQELDHLTLERIYFFIYQAIQELTANYDTEGQARDPDEFLDAAYLVSERYQETDNFHLALELYKQIIPVAQLNHRFDLEAACRIQIGMIYKKYFPMSAEYILDALKELDFKHLNETNNKLLEIYHCLMGHAYREADEEKLALESFRKAINVTDQDISAPQWIAEAYHYLGSVDKKNHYLKDATRYYLTAVSIAFSAGNLAMADEYRHAAAEVELHIANSVIHSSLVHRMEMDHKDAEYRAWESLRVLVKAYIHCLSDQYQSLRVMTEEILYHSRIILRLPGKQRKNRELLDQIEDTLLNLETMTIEGNRLEPLLTISKVIEENIPIPPPTFMLLAVDGRLMTIGTITDDGWEKSDIEGTLLSGVLSAIMSLMSEVSADDSSLRTIDAGNFQIMIEQTENIMAVLLVDRDIQEFRKRLRQVLGYIDTKMGEEIKYWNGDTTIFKPLKSKVQELLAPTVVAANIDT